jgi:outer membrane protein OmpA-like peptidoglycan-associated protein
MKKIMITGFFCTLMAAGCTTIDPVTRELKPRHGTVGASMGAMGGALLGAMTGHSSKSVLIGAGLGALAGGAIGNAIDQEEAMLRAQLDNTGVGIERTGDTIRLVMPCDITFANDSANLRPEFFDTLNSVAFVLRRFNHTLVKVAGFTSNTGSIMHNQLLSEQRAQSVADFLIDAGINPARLVTVGYGIRYAIASNNTEEGQALNRRVEITIRPMKID